VTTVGGGSQSGRAPRRSLSRLLPRTIRARRAEALSPPDRSTALQTAAALTRLDGIEHRVMELGEPWPQLVVGPTGATVLDVCRIDGPVEVVADGVRDGIREVSCGRCDAAALAATAVRETFEQAGLAVPVRTVTVMPSGTSIVVAADAPCDVVVITIEDLGDVLARGPVLPMTTVDAAFARAARTLTTDARLSHC
jgi:8-oxo-dGTP pyrophosphatase MutT (NUDIX family)